MIKFIKAPDALYGHRGDDYTTIKYIINTNELTIDDMLEQFTHFLLACGYQLPSNSTLQFDTPPPQAVFDEYPTNEELESAEI